jgi:hypothetical protein
MTSARVQVSGLKNHDIEIVTYVIWTMSCLPGLSYGPARCAPRKEENMKGKPPANRLPEVKRDMARALLEAGKSYREIAEALGMSVGSVHNIMREPAGETAAIVVEIKSRFSQKFYMLSDHVLGRISDFNITEATLKEKAIAAAILAEKAIQIERSLPLNMPEQGVPAQPEEIKEETGGSEGAA